MVTAAPSLSLPALVGSAFLISFATVVVPGPITVVASRLALRQLPAAVWFLVGVTVLDVTLFLALAAGAAPLVRGLGGLPLIEIVGGLILLWAGVASLRHAPRQREPGAPAREPKRPEAYFFLGMAVAAGNPHYWIWWLSAGLALIQAASGYGVSGLAWLLVALVGGVVGWYVPLLAAVRRGRTLLTASAEAWVFKGLSLVMIGLGAALIAIGIGRL